jgi:Putative transmembrane protein (PGPGW)
VKRVYTAWNSVPRRVRQGGVLVVGSLMLAGGIALLVLPGPGLLVIAVGLAVLATEFAWPRRLLSQVTSRLPSRWRPRSGASGQRAGTGSPSSR